MNRFAYRTTGFAIKALLNLSRARINIHGEENIPDGAIIFVINHFTRIETLLLPSHIFKLTQVPVWSLASADLFGGAMDNFLDNMGAISTADPDRDRLIIKTLLTGEASWAIFPEGRMVKNKKIIEKGRFMLSVAGGRYPPHSGAAGLALRTEFYRQRIKLMLTKQPAEARRLAGLFEIEDLQTVIEKKTFIIPVNLTYYPVRARENILSKLADSLVQELPARAMEELMTEGSMLLSGVDMDIRFGKPLQIEHQLKHQEIAKDIASPEEICFDDRIPCHKRMRKEALIIMQQYMEAIYSMTTVNHDHLFASFLKHIPRKKISIQNLKNRVYLIILKELKKSPFYLHHSLLDDQIHLLSDDRFHKFDDLVSLAEEKGIVDFQGDFLLKDNSKLKSFFDFHRVRIDNPIAVIANEVEPLFLLQKKISCLAWQPDFMIRRKVVKTLLKKAIKDFKKDYDHFFVDAESKPREVGTPFLIKGNFKRKVGVVLAHGYMAAPEEVRALATYLGCQGFWVYAPRLTGHGTTPEDLAACSYQDWINSYEKGYAVIRNLCQKVVLGGFSMGAGLALELAARIPEVDAVFAVSAPLGLQDFNSKFVPAVDVWNKIMNKINRVDAAKEFVENQPENPHINYSRNPIAGIREMGRLMVDMEARLKDIKAPALVVQSRQDPVVNPKSAGQIFNKIGSEDKQLVLFNFDRHGILLGKGSERVHRVIGNFIGNLITKKKES